MQSNNKQPKVPQHPKQNANSDTLKLVTVYFRLSTKIGVKMIVPNQMTVKEISSMAETELKIETKYQIIYFASRKYESDWPVILDLEEGSIIHIHDKRSMGLGKIKISIQEIKVEGQKTKPIEFSVNSDLKIHQFIQLHLERENVLLAESGRWLDLNRTFRQENVENQATIYCISKFKQLDHDEFEKDFNNLFQDQQETQKPTNQQTFSKVKEERQKRLESRRTKKQQMSSSSEIQTLPPRFDFKKKKQSICLKAVKKNPEDIGYTWKIDRSSSSSKSSKKLARALKGKRKNKKQVSNNEQDTENERMSLNAKLKLRQQIKKLFMSQNLGLKAANKNKPSLTSSGEIGSSKEVEAKQNILFEQCLSQAVF